MKRLVSWMVVAFVLSAFTIVGVHWKQVRKMQENFSLTQTRWEREDIANGLVLTLEKYRRKSGSFRKLNDAEIAAAKKNLQDEIRDGLAKLESSNPKPEERALIDQVRNQFAELQVLSVKTEPMVFTRDVYVKAPVQELHEAIISNLIKIGKRAKSESEVIRSETNEAAMTNMRFLIFATIVAMILVALMLLRNFYVHAVPLRTLRSRAKDFARGVVPSYSGLVRPLKGYYGEIEQTLKELTSTLEAQRTERRGFITAIASDLRSPLAILQSGTKMLRAWNQGSNDPARMEAIFAMERSLFKLSRTLEDLNDIVDANHQPIQLDERLIDIRDLLVQTCNSLSGAGSRYEVSISVPSMPVWASVDPQRMERVIINLISKMMNLQPQGGRIAVTMTDPALITTNAGVEILIEDGEKSAKNPGVTSAPEQDLIRHWVAQSGFGMSLAYRIVQVHGGSITASGVAGTSVMFIIRLPKSRVASELIPSTLASRPIVATPAVEQNRGTGFITA